MTHLIRHRHKDRAQEQVRTEGIRLLAVGGAPRHQIVGHLAQDRQGHHEIVPICLDKVVPRYRRRVDVVLSEGP